MLYRTLGKTNLKVSEVGIGTWQLARGGDMWTDPDENESLKALAHFVDMGGNFIDSAWIYGYVGKTGHRYSHELIGKFLAESKLRNKLIIASKVPPKNMHWPALPGVPVSEVFPPDWIASCVDDTLRDLNTDYLDLMQFHVWQDYFVEDDAWKSAVQKIIKSGKVRFWGISVNDYQPDNCLKTLDTGLISAVQFIFNIFHQKPTETLLPYAAKNNIGLIARVPLDEGGLTGKFSQNTKLPSADFRNHYFREPRLAELVKRTDALKTLIPDSQSLTQFALRYILSWPEVSTVIPGMRKTSYVDTNISVSDGRKLPPALLSELKNHSWERNFYI